MGKTYDITIITHLTQNVGRRQEAVGSWQLAVGSWQLAVGSWQ